LRSYGTPNYYVQQLFSRNRGDRVLPVKLDGALPKENEKPRFYATAALDEKSHEIIVKVVNASKTVVETRIDLEGATKPRESRLGSANFLTKAILLAAAPQDENSFANPKQVAPVTASEMLALPRFDYSFKPYSLTIFRLPAGH
jgi:alpha-N-arabinofuranosidase